MCSPKTMFKIGIPIAGILLAGYFMFPQFRSAIAGLAPFALFALCPLAMVFGMNPVRDREGPQRPSVSNGVKGMMGKNAAHQCSSCDNPDHTQAKKPGFPPARE